MDVIKSGKGKGKLFSTRKGSPAVNVEYHYERTGAPIPGFTIHGSFAIYDNVGSPDFLILKKWFDSGETLTLQTDDYEMQICITDDLKWQFRATGRPIYRKG